MIGEETAAAFVARRLREEAPSFVESFLGKDTALVPVPRSSLQRPGALWPALEIANELHRCGFGSGVLRCLLRKSPVNKAALAEAKERPRAGDHAESLELIDALAIPAKLTLVDDVITRGAQLVGAARCIWVARGDIEVRAFAVIRTMSAPTDFAQILAPCEGTVSLRRSGDCVRSP